MLETTATSDEIKALPNETENLDLSDAFLPDDFVSGTAPAEDVLSHLTGSDPILNFHQNSQIISKP